MENRLQRCPYLKITVQMQCAALYDRGQIKRIQTHSAVFASQAKVQLSNSSVVAPRTGLKSHAFVEIQLLHV